MRECFSESYTKFPAGIMKEEMLFWNLNEVSCWYHEGENAFLKVIRSFLLVSWMRTFFSESYTKVPAVIMNEKMLFWNLYKVYCCYHEWENAFLKLIGSFLLLSWMRKCFSETYTKFPAVIMNEKILFSFSIVFTRQYMYILYNVHNTACHVSFIDNRGY